MRTCAALLACLCLCLSVRCSLEETPSVRTDADTRTTEVEDAAPATTFTQQTSQPDIHTVLREMSAQLAEQKAELRCMETRLRASESKAEMESRLRASEKTVEEQRLELRYTKTQLESLEKTVEEQRAVIKELKEKQEEQQVSVNLTGSQVEELRREREERRVSFSACLLASVETYTGPFSEFTPLVFKHVITNIGKGYDSNTGVFTAPVRGVYSFYFSVFGNSKPRPSGATLHKNGIQIVVAYTLDGWKASSNGASLLLEVGDVVQVKLFPNSQVWDHQNHHNSFSGHLLFPM